MIRLEFFVPGKPRGEARPRVTIHGTYIPRATREAKKAVADAFRAALAESDGKNRIPDSVTYCKVSIFAKYPIAKSWDNKKKYEAAHGLIIPGKPDVDNVAKLVLDALNGVAYRDDQCVYELLVTKSFDPAPGLHIRLELEE